jgi:hypothetical protein
MVALKFEYLWFFSPAGVSHITSMDKGCPNEETLSIRKSMLQDSYETVQLCKLQFIQYADSFTPRFHHIQCSSLCNQLRPKRHLNNQNQLLSQYNI